jgi:predicted hydrocarbon binding protein
MYIISDTNGHLNRTTVGPHLHSNSFVYVKVKCMLVNMFHTIMHKAAYEFGKDMAKQQLEDLMRKEMEILKIMSKPSYEEKEQRKPIVGTLRLNISFRNETLLP